MSDKDLPSFTTPLIHLNPEGWGPVTLPEKYIGVPFFPFSKSDRVGKAADFVGRELSKNFRFTDSGNNQQSNINPNSFSVVDTFKPRATAAAQPTLRNNRRQRPNYAAQAAVNAKQAEAEANKPTLKGKQLKYVVQNKRGKQWRRPRGAGRNYRRPTRQQEASIKVRAEWEVVEQLDLSALTKLQIQPPKGTDLKFTGTLLRYDDSYEKCSARIPKALAPEKHPHSAPNNTSLDDPTLEELVSTPGDEGKVRVFATDELLAQLMVSPRSVAGWDLYFTKVEGGVVFLDKRDSSEISQLTVNETAQVIRTDEEEAKLSSYNRPEKLSEEATKIQNTFRQQILDRSEKGLAKKKVFTEENPLLDEDEEEDSEAYNEVGYRYRKFDLGGSYEVMVRTEVHGIVRQVVSKKVQKKYMTSFAINEWDYKLAQSIDWRQKIDMSRGGVLATELKNNAFKFAKWAARSLLADADIMKLGFVSRKARTDPRAHVILGVQSYDPKVFAGQINLSEKNMWGILKAMLDIVMKQEGSNGKFLLVKDPNKQLLRVYRVPMEMFQESESEEEEESEGDEEEDEEEFDDGEEDYASYR